MHKLVVLYPEPKDRQTFVDYYESTHLPLVQKLPGLLAWRYSTAVSDGSASYFAVFEADFADTDTFRRAISSEQGQAVQADVPNYASGGAVVLDYLVIEGDRR